MAPKERQRRSRRAAPPRTSDTAEAERICIAWAWVGEIRKRLIQGRAHRPAVADAELATLDKLIAQHRTNGPWAALDAYGTPGLRTATASAILAAWRAERTRGQLPTDHMATRGRGQGARYSNQARYVIGTAHYHVERLLRAVRDAARSGHAVDPELRALAAAALWAAHAWGPARDDARWPWDPQNHGPVDWPAWYARVQHAVESDDVRTELANAYSRGTEDRVRGGPFSAAALVLCEIVGVGQSKVEAARRAHDRLFPPG